LTIQLNSFPAIKKSPTKVKESPIILYELDLTDDDTTAFSKEGDSIQWVDEDRLFTMEFESADVATLGLRLIEMGQSKMPENYISIDDFKDDYQTKPNGNHSDEAFENAEEDEIINVRTTKYPSSEVAKNRENGGFNTKPRENGSFNDLMSFPFEEAEGEDENYQELNDKCEEYKEKDEQKLASEGGDDSLGE
jgi:hypothetical protein